MSIDNYEIVKELGRGGMGAVFLANDKRLKRQVAIKVLKIPAGFDASQIEDTVNNFKREAVAIANLTHNNIVCVYDIGSKDNLHYIVMELIDGATLTSLLKSQGHPFSLETTLKISDEICDALIYTHKNNVIHRDIKPENIIYTSKGVSKLTDFGIAKFAGEENLNINEAPGMIKGTILYISPEQLQTPDLVDGRADMYSFAVSMYEMLTGRLPFEGDNPRNVIMKILTEEPIAPSKITTDLLPHIDHVILKALAKDPSKRYSNIQEFRDELKNISEFRARYAVQPMKISETKEEKYYYNQISIHSYADVIKYSKILPDAGQQRLLYEIEMLFHKYMEEYKDHIIHRTNAIDMSNLADDVDEADLSFESHIDVEDMGKPNSGFVDSFNYVIPKLTQLGSDSVKGMAIPMDLIIFLGKINSKSTLKQFFDTNYPEKTHEAFNQIYNCVQKNYITLEVTGTPKAPILIGDMMLILRIVTKFQLDFALKKKKELDGTPNSKLIGEVLLESGYLTRDKLLHTLKLQHWYRRLFG
ncbi:MAG: serine/threonine-protein kinase [Candidatus Sericytochromatia bacterium]